MFSLLPRRWWAWWRWGEGLGAPVDVGRLVPSVAGLRNSVAVGVLGVGWAVPVAGVREAAGWCAFILVRVPDAFDSSRGRSESGVGGVSGGRSGGGRSSGRGRGRGGRVVRRPLTQEERAARDAARAKRRQARLAAVPQVSYPEHLPVAGVRDEILAAIRENQVVVIAGETGSGKTTQIPKMCLELGRGIDGQIGHTQPRRIAARSVAERLAEELGVEIGGAVGYQVRFNDASSRDTLVKVMTDGILLAELQRDRYLRRYDTIIIDEAHERSLNIDFILGYLRQLLPKRPDLKVIVTSATIDPEKFANHFAGPDGRPAPILEVSGRTYPVEIRYRPLVREQVSRSGERVEVEVDQVYGITEAVEELWTESRGDGGDQDVLVFCSGEREIRDAVDALEAMKFPDTQVLPLYGRLPAAEQHRIFAGHSGRRIVVSTNVAETSLTVPGIRYVVDTGTARISRFNQRTKVQRLPIEAISQASANQRSGRSGRLSDGVAIRLYSEEDFAGRPEFTDPEIMRTNLASVILQMISLGLGDISGFPFVDPPDRRQISDGVRLLQELGAIEAGEKGPHRLTRLGRDIARIPVDPRLARMLIAADRNGTLREVIVIVAGLSIQDVRERPSEGGDSARADQAHARFKVEGSDFMTLLAVWDYLSEQQRVLSGSAFRRLCRDEYLHFLRFREWQDLVSQLRDTVKELGLRVGTGTSPASAVHQALLTGLLSQVGAWDQEKREYVGARGARFAIGHGSVLRRVNPEWVMSAELVETTRLWARTNAVTSAVDVEEAAAHVVKRSHSEPRWSRGRAAAIADERVTLFGVPLVIGRRVALAPIDPQLARDLFIRHALVEGDWDTPHRFFHDNRKLLDRLAELESRARRRDLLVDDSDLVAFYDERIPASVTSGAAFDAWWKDARRADPDLLTFTQDVLVADTANAGDGPLDEALRAKYPHVWQQGELSFRLTYEFDPGGAADGVTCHIPLAVLNQVENVGFDWLVPGLREDLAIALVKSLPKATRKQFVPAPDRARAALAAISVEGEPEPGSGPESGLSFADELARGLYIVTGKRVPEGEWGIASLPAHLRMSFTVEDDRRRAIAEGKDLEALQEELAPKVRGTMKKAAADLERKAVTSWDFGELPSEFEGKRGKNTVKGFPALVDHGDSVAIEVLGTRRQQETATHDGLRRLVLLNSTAPWQRILTLLSNSQRLALGNNPHGGIDALLEDVLAAAVDAIIAEQESGMSARIRTAEAFDQVLAAVKREVVPHVMDIVDMVVPVLERSLKVRLALDAMHADRVKQMRADMEQQLAGLVYPGFVAATGMKQLAHVARYLQAMLVRIEKGPLDLRKDAASAEVVARVEQERLAVVAKLPVTEHGAADVVQLRWLVEELRVSLFAQRLGTAVPVSEKRIYAAMDRVEDARD